MQKKRGEELYLEVYLDVLFVVNFLMNLILLTIVKKVLKWESNIFRRLLGGSIGAIGACMLALFPNQSKFIQFISSYLIICLLMILVSFKITSGRMGLKGLLVLYLTTFFLGGLFNSLYYHSMLGFYFHELINGRLFVGLDGWKIVLLIITGTIGVLIFIKVIYDFRRESQDIYEVTIYLNEKNLALKGLLDTGNNLYDPIFAKPVIIIEFTSIIKLLSKEEVDHIKIMLGSNDIKGPSTTDLKVFMIPYKSIGKKKGLLPAIKIDKIEIKRVNDVIISENVLTGIWDGHLSKQGKYQVILHRDLM
ncbi:MAG: sigma-E processing peptidase SpoIIGA [Clostridiales bacterium]|nr:sigma-E processing peptidase SpoIIGA [Clostridiales bacterium]